MAVQEAVIPVPSARVVGNAFVEQYYHILHQSPNLVYRFYQDSSLLSRPDNSGNITTVTTTQGINEKIMSLQYEDVTAEIKTADAQESYGRGVIVLVTGCLTGKDAVKRNFSQTFFLAPQEKGYFVLNDVFRYVEESAPPTSSPTNADIDSLSTAATSAAATSAAAELPPEQEPVIAPDQHPEEPEASLEEEELNNVPEVCDPSDNEGSVNEEEAVELEVVDTAPAVEDDAPKKSYASILKVVQGNVVTRKVQVTSTALKVAPPKEQPQPSPVKPSTPATSGPTSNDGVQEGSNVPEVEGYSIYVRNLPYEATVELLEGVFKNFGPIKPHGIQVRSNKGACFGFVEFENLASMQSAIQASPVEVGDRRAVVEEKRTTTRVGGRGRFPPGRGGFRNESFRARGSFTEGGGGGRGYGRSTEYRTQTEFSPRPRGPVGPTGTTVRGGEGFRPYQNGRGRGGRVGPGRGGPVPV